MTTSAFGPGGAPSTARVSAALRQVSEDATIALGPQTVERMGERLREAAELLTDLALMSEPPDRAESFRYLLTLLAYTVDSVVLATDPLEPMFSAPHRNHLVDWGAASPDGVYRRASIRHDRSYRVSGRLGNADYFTIDFRTSPHPVAIGRDEITAADDGTFELFLGGGPRERNWWPLPEGTSGLLVREFFADWLHAERSHLRIECLDGGIAPRPEHNPARVAAEFNAVADWIVDGGVRFWVERSQHAMDEARNAFRPEVARTETKLPVYTHGLWDLAADETLLIELPDPRARYWGFQLASSLWHTLDYANRLTTFNCRQSHCDDDGVFRFVVAHADPGVHNWLDTTGLRRGILILRYHTATQLHVPVTRVVPFDEVGALVAGTRTCTPDERRAQIAERREGVARLVCD